MSNAERELTGGCCCRNGSLYVWVLFFSYNFHKALDMSANTVSAVETYSPDVTLQTISGEGLYILGISLHFYIWCDESWMKNEKAMWLERIKVYLRQWSAQFKPYLVALFKAFLSVKCVRVFCTVQSLLKEQFTQNEIWLKI